ncbi:MAG: hypothetical protein MUO63_07095 [Desulfobulbaceae bacterium]|nr:hypothetical protein [Desulfobulbaceae bacterium]
MAERRTCKHCHNGFYPRPQNPDQQYCSERECQRARKRIWQKKKLLTDSDYQANQHEAQRCWQEDNPDYWQDYRKRHPDYVDRNRELQRDRNRRRRGQDTGQVTIAKMDASMPKIPINPGRYLLSRVDSGVIAKMDALIVEIHVVSSG